MAKVTLKLRVSAKVLGRATVQAAGASWTLDEMVKKFLTDVGDYDSPNHATALKWVRECSVSEMPKNTFLQYLVSNGELDEILDSRLIQAETAISNPDKVIAKVSYMLNGTELKYHPVETYGIDGQHIMALHYYLGSVSSNTVNTFVIMLEATGGTCSFDINAINVLLSGMGLAATEKWDGTFTIEEKFEGIGFESILGTFQEEVSVRQMVPQPIGPSDAFSFSFASILGGMRDTVEISKIVKYYILSDTEGAPEWSEDYVAINSDDAFVLRTEYMAESKRAEVDDGYLDVLDIHEAYDEIVTTEGLVVT